MQTKLTLRLEQELVVRVKEYAQRRGKSVSQIVADFFWMLDQPDSEIEALPPITQSLKGALRGAEVDEQDYRRYLEEKYR